MFLAESTVSQITAVTACTEGQGIKFFSNWRRRWGGLLMGVWTDGCTCRSFWLSWYQPVTDCHSLALSQLQLSWLNWCNLTSRYGKTSASYWHRYWHHISIGINIGIGTGIWISISIDIGITSASTSASALVLESASASASTLVLAAVVGAMEVETAPAEMFI